MSSELGGPSVRFEPLRPISHHRLIVALVLGPVLWLVALVVAAWLFDYSSAIPFAWGIAIAAVATLQLILALDLERVYDPSIFRAFLPAALYPLAYWTIAAAAALRSQTVGLLRGPRGHRVVWDIPRERLGPGLERVEDSPSRDR